MSRVHPVFDKIIIKPELSPEKTSGGLLVPNSVREELCKGEIVSVGEGTEDQPMVFEPGQVIIHKKFAGTEIIIDETKHLIMSQADILAFIG